MVDVRGGIDDDPQAGEPRAPAELEVLEVHEELLGEASESSKRLGAHGHRGPAGRGDLAHLADRLGRLAVAAGPADSAHVHLRPRGVQELRLVQQAKARHCDPDRLIGQTLLEATQRTRRDHRVRVEEDEDVASGFASAQIGTGCKADVLAG